MMMRSLRISQPTDTQGGLLNKISEAYFICEEGFFTEWKLGNTPNEKPRDPAFGGVFFLLLHVEANIDLLCSSTMLS